MLRAAMVFIGTEFDPKRDHSGPRDRAHVGQRRPQQRSSARVL